MAKEKHQKLSAPKTKYKKRLNWHPETREEFEDRLWSVEHRGEVAEERQRPWGVATSQPEYSKQVDSMPPIQLRAVDQSSKCQIRDHRVGIPSTGSDERLDTLNRRLKHLKNHADWQGWKGKTPFISTTSHFEQITQSVIPRLKKRQGNNLVKDNIKLTLFNPRARLAAGLPILRVDKELRHYNMKDKAIVNPDAEYHRHEYLLPFNAGPKEIVGTWTWQSIELWMDKNFADFPAWMKEVGYPALEEHERVRLGGAPKLCKIGCSCCGM